MNKSSEVLATMVGTSIEPLQWISELVSVSGSKLVLNIIEMKFDQDLKDNFFTFDEKAYPDVDVIDMR